MDGEADIDPMIMLGKWTLFLDWKRRLRTVWGARAFEWFCEKVSNENVVFNFTEHDLFSLFSRF